MGGSFALNLKWIQTRYSLPANSASPPFAVLRALPVRWIYIVTVEPNMCIAKCSVDATWMIAMGMMAPTPS